MVEIDVENWNRKNTYKWFKTFSNTTYSCNVVMDVTKLVNHAKMKNESFFIDLLYIVLKGLNSIEEMRMRLVDEKPVIFDDINPAYTVMAESGTFENVRYKNQNDFKTFYKISEENIQKAKVVSQVEEQEYNPENCYDEYYITCLPWINFTQFTHPIPDDVQSQCIPRICWGKYIESNGRFELTLNITVSHLFVDGKPLADAFNGIQDLLNNVDEILQ